MDAQFYQITDYGMRHTSVNVLAYGAVCDGVTDDSLAMNNAAQAVYQSGGGTVILPNEKIKASNVPMMNGVYYQGTGTVDPESGGECTRIVGTSGLPTFLYPTTPTRRTGIRNLTIYGGQNGIEIPNAAVNHVYMSLIDLVITGCIESSVKMVTSRLIEEMYWQRVSLYGAQYGVLATIGRLDKSTFRQVETKTQSLNGWNLILTGSDVGYQGISSQVLWDQLILHTCGGYGFYVQSDTSTRSWTFINPYSEAIGTNGKNTRTTGSITSGTNTLTVSAATGFANGDPITVKGAGTGGQDLTSTIVSGETTVNLVLQDNALTTVTALEVTNAQYDDFCFDDTLGATFSDITFLNGNLQGDTAGGKCRYAINLRGVSPYTNIFDVTIGNGRPIYDRFKTVQTVGRNTVRVPGSLNDAVAGNGIGISSGAWNGQHLQMGLNHLWIDASNRLRIKVGVPTSDTDGVVVGTQA